MKNIVYGLADSRNDLIYYVGKSSIGSKRALQHLTKSHSPEVNEWIEEVRYNWGNIKVIIIEEVEDINLLSEREKYWIGVYSISNTSLLNKKDYPHLINSYTDKDDEKFSFFKDSILFAGEIIKKRRLALNVTQGKLAKVSQVNRSTISQIENNFSVSLDSLKKVTLGLTRLGMDKQMEFAQIKERARSK